MLECRTVIGATWVRFLGGAVHFRLGVSLSMIICTVPLPWQFLVKVKASGTGKLPRGGAVTDPCLGEFNKALCDLKGKQPTSLPTVVPGGQPVHL